MKKILLLVVLTVFSVASFGFAAGEGHHDLPWGKNVEEFTNIEFAFEKGDLKYYRVDSEEVCEITKITNPEITYVFKDGKLAARIVEIESVEDYDKVEQHLIDSFGEPKKKQDGPWTVYRWKGGDVKVKLKANRSDGRMKIGMYYTPIYSE